MPRISNERALAQCIDSLQSLFAGGEAFILLGQVKRVGYWRWEHARVQEIPTLLGGDGWETTPDGSPVDLYARQHLFVAKWPGGVDRAWYSTLSHLWSLGIDMDSYKTHPGIVPKAVAKLAVDELSRRGVPRPNVIDLSGGGQQGGFYLRWLICPVNVRGYDYAGIAKLRIQYEQTKLGLCQVLQPFGADRKALDVIRLLRVPGSVNTKYLAADGTGHPATREWLHRERTPLEQLTAGIQPLPMHASGPFWAEGHDCREIRPVKVSQGQAASSAIALTQAPTEAVQARAAGWNAIPAEPNRSVTGDTRTDGRRNPNFYAARLMERVSSLRGGISKGHRNTALFKYVICLKSAGMVRKLVLDRAEALAASFQPRLDRNEFHKTFESGWSADPYRYSYDAIVQTLDVTPEELATLGVTVSPRRHLADGSDNPDYQRHVGERQRQYTTRKRLQKAGLEGIASSVREARKILNLQKIVDAISEIRAKGAIPSKTSVARHTGLSYGTVARYWPANDDEAKGPDASSA